MTTAPDPAQAGERPPHVFIGSSREQIAWARAVQDELDPDAETTVWQQGIFHPSRSDLQSIKAEAARSDFAVFIFAPDDLTLMREEEHRVVRDNVIFELGLFIGEIGQQRCFLLVPSGEQLDLPTDLMNMPTLGFRHRREDRNRAAAVGRACNQVRHALELQGVRSRSPFESVAEARVAAVLVGHAATAGLIGSYSCRADATRDIIQSMHKGGCIRLLSNKGDDWLGDDGPVARAIDVLEARETRFDFRTILQHADAPWLKTEAPKLLDRTAERIREEYAAAHALAEEWCARRRVRAPRYHRHHPSWRLIQTCDDLFISTYVTNDQMKVAPVLRFSPGSPIYLSVKRYFDFLFKHCSAPRGGLAPFERLQGKRVSLEASAGVVVVRGEGDHREVLLSKRPDGALALPKGHIEDGELPFAAALRELLEETGGSLVAEDLDLLGFRPLAYVLPDELIAKAVLFYAAPASPALPIDPNRATWLPLHSLDAVEFVDDYIADLLRDVRDGRPTPRTWIRDVGELHT